MSQAAIEQEVTLEGDVEHPQVIQRYFKTLDGLADFIKTFKIVQGGFNYGNYPVVGLCYLLEYPMREQG